MNSLQKRLAHLPQKPELIKKFLLFEKAKLQARTKALQKIKRTEEGVAGYQAALENTQDLAEYLLYAEARLGEILANRDRTYQSSGRGTLKEKPLPSPIDKKASHFAQTLYKNQDKIAEVVATAKEKGEVPLRQHVLNRVKDNVHFMSNSNQWNTPKDIISRVLIVLKQIDLDPCSDSQEHPHIPAVQYFTKESNGLSQTWFGKVYMNPPYGSEIIKWTSKLQAEYESNHVTEAIMLVPARTDTEWFRASKKYLRCLIFGRLRFGDSDNSAPFPSMAVYFGKNRNTFIDSFSIIGDIYECIT